MTRLLITSGPTREYLDDVRYLSNASSGRMGTQLANGAVELGWDVVFVTGPAEYAAPNGAEIIPVVSACEMLETAIARLPMVDGIIAVAAVTDYRPKARIPGKMVRSDQPRTLELEPNPDILAEIGRRKQHRWSVGFAVDSSLREDRAREKLAAKNCDAIVLNRSGVIAAENTEIAIMDRNGAIVVQHQGSKQSAARRIVAWIANQLVT